VDRLQTLINTPDLDPVTFLNMDRQLPFTGSLQAPYRLDCALTYRLPGEASTTGPAPLERVTRELTTAEWETIIDRAWKVGIPHLVFTGGEPTLRPDLADLLDHAEINGQVTGLLTDGLRLADDDYRHRLLATGLDHVVLLLQPELPPVWTALERLIAEDLQVTVHVTITTDNRAGLATLFDRLAASGVKNLSLSANSPELIKELQAAGLLAADRAFQLVWDLPVPYFALHPVKLELSETVQVTMNAPHGAGRAFLYVEPDGDVLPAQGQTTKLGNLLTDPWERIWKQS
jgi:MoaA/NifB/PqqE/SkfB family radical SAM enzyme